MMQRIHNVDVGTGLAWHGPARLALAMHARIEPRTDSAPLSTRPMSAGTVMSFGFFVVATLAVIVLHMRAQVRVQSIERARERRMREELEAYAKLDPMALLRRSAPNSPAAHNPAEAARMLARVVCRTVADKSVFPRIAMLLRDADGKLFCAGSAGVDDLTIAALQSWGELIVAEETSGGPIRSLTTGTGLAFGSIRCAASARSLWS